MNDDLLARADKLAAHLMGDWQDTVTDLAAALRACDAELATARAVTQRLLDGWSPDDAGWHRPIPDPPHEQRQLKDVPRSWVFKLNADDPQWRLLNTEATFMWDLNAQVLCRPQTAGGWEPMSDAERAWLASVSPPASGEDDE